VLAFWYFGGHSSAPSTAAPVASAPVQTVASVASQSVIASKLAQPPGPATPPPSAVNVTPADQEKLAQMVGLSDAKDQPLDKEKWAKAIPIAEKLLTQSCDCEQRNWLTQFVAVGNMAVDGSPDFHKFAPALATMYRDDNEMATGKPSN
ncbi:MAG: hypothetical protein ACREKL_06835, partial [Chthoniobacterales bacterium]